MIILLVVDLEMMQILSGEIDSLGDVIAIHVTWAVI